MTVLFTFSVCAFLRPSGGLRIQPSPVFLFTWHTPTQILLILLQMMYFWSEGSQCSVYKYQKISLSLPYTKIKRSHKRKWLCHRKMSLSSGHAYFFCWTIFSAHLWLLSASTHPHPFSAHVLGQPPLSSAGAWLITDYFPPRFSQPLSLSHTLSLWRLAAHWKFHDESMKYFVFFASRGALSAEVQLTV